MPFAPTPTVATTVPDGPYSLTARSASSTEIDLAWHDNSNNETGFILERQIGDSDFEPLADLPAGSDFFDGRTRNIFRLR